MHPQDSHTTMQQKIFDMDLPMETVSLYLLCCALADADTPISTRNLLNRWNADPDELLQGLNTLVAKNILSRRLSDQEGNDIYLVLDAEQWEIGP